MTLTLSPDELRELTAKRRSDAQRRALEYMGVPYKRRPDGSPAVLRIHVEALAGATIPTAREPQLQP